LGNASLPNFAEDGPNTAAIVLAKDVCLTFAKVTGISEAFFASIKSL